MEKYFKRKRCGEQNEIEDCGLKKHKLDANCAAYDGEETSTSKDKRTESEKCHVMSRGDTDPLQYNTDCTLIKYIRPNDGLNLHFYPNFLNYSKIRFKKLEKELTNYYDKSPNVVKVFGSVHTIPRLQTAFGDPGTSYTFSGITLSSNPWISSISNLKDIVETVVGEKFSFVLVNYYRNGLDHMGEHQDDVFSKTTIASLSFGQERDFVFRHLTSRKCSNGSSVLKRIPSLKFCLSNGSLLVMFPPTNKCWYHSLPIRRNVHGARINLTFRQL